MGEALEFAEVCDLDEISNLYSEKIRSSYASGAVQWTEAYINETCNKDYLRSRIEAQDYFVLKEDGKIVAGCVLTERDEYDLWEEPCEYSVFVFWLVSIKKGAGRSLLRHIKNYCRKNEYKYIKLHCRNEVDGLKAFYTKFGFKEIAIVPSKLRKGDFSCLLKLDV